MMGDGEAGAARRQTAVAWLARAFVRVGVLPVLLVAALVIFGLWSDRFLTVTNLTNVLRQSSYLAMVSMGQMLVLLTGGFDLSVGTMLALTSVVSAMTMTAVLGLSADLIWPAILAGMVVGMCAGLAVGVVNGIGVSVFGVSPFIMTLGMASVGFGIALFLTGGMPVYGMPGAFSDLFGFGNILGVPTPILVTLLLFVIAYVLVNWTRMGRYLYAIGGNVRASQLSGISTRLYLFFAYVLCAAMTTVAGLMLTARMETGEANSGRYMPLESIAACVIAGVSLRGGVGRVELVLIGAVFITLIQNGMNLAKVQSYLQIVVTGMVLILAVIADQMRQRLMAHMRD